MSETQIINTNHQHRSHSASSNQSNSILLHLTMSSKPPPSFTYHHPTDTDAAAIIDTPLNPPSLPSSSRRMPEQPLTSPPHSQPRLPSSVTSSLCRRSTTSRTLSTSMSRARLVSILDEALAIAEGFPTVRPAATTHEANGKNRGQ